MRGYGLPRNWDVQYPDKGDIRLYGLNMEQLLKPQSKANTRRIWKKIERLNQKKLIREELKNGNVD